MIPSSLKRYSAFRFAARHAVCAKMLHRLSCWRRMQRTGKGLVSQSVCELSWPFYCHVDEARLMACRLLRRQASLQQIANKVLPCSPSSIFLPHLASLAFAAPPLYEPGCSSNCASRDLRYCLSGVRESSASAAALAEVAQQDSSGDPHVQLTAAGRYTLEFFTGDVRGAGTPVPATIRLVGTEGESQDFVLGDNPEEPGFRRGENVTYEVEVDDDLGDLRSIFVRQVRRTTRLYQ